MCRLKRWPPKSPWRNIHSQEPRAPKSCSIRAPIRAPKSCSIRVPDLGPEKGRSSGPEKSYTIRVPDSGPEKMFHLGSDGGELRSNWGAHGRNADHHRCGLRRPAGLREPGLHLHGHERRSVDGQRGLRRRDELGHGLRAAALRVQHAHRDQHLRLLGRSLLDEELGGLEQAASVQQQRGPRQRPGAAAAGQPEREGLPGARRRGAPVRADHDQRRGAGADEEPLDAAVLDHEPEEPRLPRDRRQHGQSGLQHELQRICRTAG